MKRHFTSLALVALAFAASGTARAQQAITPDQLIGTWKLRSQVVHNAATTGDDTVSHFVLGYLTFVRDGNNLRASVNFAAAGRKQAIGYATDDEAVQLFRSYSAYSGIVELSSTATAEGTPATTTIDVDLNPHGIGPHPRIYILDGTRLSVISQVSTIITTTFFEKTQ
jgi:VanZ family protein